MYAAQQTVQQQMQSLLTHLQQPGPAPCPSSALPLSFPALSIPVLQPHTTRPDDSTPPTAMQLEFACALWTCRPIQEASMAPPLVANMTDRSLALFFPDVRPVLLLAITKH